MQLPSTITPLACAIPKGIKLIVDTREQRPLWCGDSCIRHKLPVGDYSTVKLHKHFIVERKSAQDLYGTIIQGHVRFRKELFRAEHLKIKLLLVVEATKDDFINKRFPRGEQRKIEPERLDKIITTICRKHKLEVLWCSSRTQAGKKIVQRFIKEQNKLKRIKL